MSTRQPDPEHLTTADLVGILSLEALQRYRDQNRDRDRVVYPPGWFAEVWPQRKHEHREPWFVACERELNRRIPSPTPEE